MAVTIVDGELTVEPMRVDTFEHGLSLLDATEATAQSHSGFGSEYRRQLEEAMEAMADTNKVRKRLEKVQELNAAIQQGTHDPTLTKEGSVASAYQQWLDANAERLQRVRARHRSGQQQAAAAVAAKTACDVTGADIVAVAPAAPLQPPVISEEDLAEMLTCHRELLAVLSSVTLDADEEAELETEVAAAHASAEAKAAAVVARASATEEAVSTTSTPSEEGRETQQQTDDADELIASIPLVASQPPTEYVNDWDREVYGVEQFDDDVLDDFESSMAELMNQEFAAARAQVIVAQAPAPAEEVALQLDETD